MVDPSPSSELSIPAAPDHADPELLRLPRPRRPERTVSLALMGATFVLAFAMVVSLAGDVRYALNSSLPEDLGDLSRVIPTPELHNKFVSGAGRLGPQGAMRYERPLESDSFRLAPLVGNNRIWVEMRVPEGARDQDQVPPTAFVGRFVPFDRAGFQHRGLRHSVLQVTGVTVPPEAWLLVDGACPAASRWTVALAALFAVFASWSLLAIARILRPIHLRRAA